MRDRVDWCESPALLRTVLDVLAGDASGADGESALLIRHSESLFHAFAIGFVADVPLMSVALHRHRIALQHRINATLSHARVSIQCTSVCVLALTCVFSGAARGSCWTCVCDLDWCVALISRVFVTRTPHNNVCVLDAGDVTSLCDVCVAHTDGAYIVGQCMCDELLHRVECGDISGEPKGKDFVSMLCVRVGGPLCAAAFVS